MQEIPGKILSYLQDALIGGRYPACLQVSRNGVLLSRVGTLEPYGLAALAVGAKASEQAPLLEGLLHLSGPPALLPFVQTPSGRYADIHIIPDKESDWVVFLDADSEHAQKAALQQKANELSLLKKRRKKAETRASDPVGSLFGAPDGVVESEELEIPAGLLAKLQTVAMEMPGNGSARVLGAAADWFQQLYPEFISGQPVSSLGERFPFLDNFLFDAEEFWKSGSDGRLKSGPWSETSAPGAEVYLEASAVLVGPNRVLLIERLGSQYEENQSLLQKARELRLEEQRRVKETQKKEILLHCIVHDLAGPLSGIKGALSLLKFENMSPKGKELLEAGLRQTAKQEKWIRTILEVFSAEVASLETFANDPAQAPDAAVCAREVVQALLPAAAAEQIRLQLSSAVDQTLEWKVAGERSRLERILFNLVENALRHTARVSTVTVGLERKADSITVMVDDEGPGIAPEVAANLFQKFSQGEGNTGKAGLGLYFCRITVERWGGEIGCHSLPERGARFWFRLPAVSP